MVEVEYPCGCKYELELMYNDWNLLGGPHYSHHSSIIEVCKAHKNQTWQEALKRLEGEQNQRRLTLEKYASK